MFFLLSVVLYDGTPFMIKQDIKLLIFQILEGLKFQRVDFVIEHPDDLSHGDYSTNVALLIAKQEGKKPQEIAELFRDAFEKEKPKYIEKIEVAGPGFLNFFLSQDFFIESLEHITQNGSEFGKGNIYKDQKTMVEYTDPNPIKEFHIGHLMSNAIGESIARIIGANGAEVKRACYQGDVGLHVAKAVAQKIDTGVDWNNVQEVAHTYALGSKRYEVDPDFKKKVVETNKLIYSKEVEEVNEIYQKGRQLALDYFESIYKILGTKFDYYFFESTSGEFGKALVHKHPEIFVQSDGAIVYKGEERDSNLHTRVFINKEGLPTYEAKELGLAKIKHDIYPYDTSVVITGNEINDYFRVLLSAMKEVFPDLAERTKHVSHGMLRLPSGKMSSRTGDVITAEWLIHETEQKVLGKINESNRGIENVAELSQEVAVGAIKYSILKQAPGKDIVFDFEKSISFDGNSGPYVQYTFARTQSILAKAHSVGLNAQVEKDKFFINDLIRVLYRYPEVVERAGVDLAPHHIVTYVTEVAALFNRFYAEEQIVDLNDTSSPMKLALTQAVGEVLRSGLTLLGIPTPDKM